MANLLHLGILLWLKLEELTVTMEIYSFRN
jgi:hypothetical protein